MLGTGRMFCGIESTLFVQLNSRIEFQVGQYTYLYLSNNSTNGVITSIDTNSGTDNKRVKL